MSKRTRRRLTFSVGGFVILTLVAMVALLGLRPGEGEATATTTSDAPTWYADVMPIVQENCVQCHQAQGKNLGGMVAPFSMTSYEEAAPYARMMAIMVEEGRMPPWDAHEIHEGDFVGEIYLSDQEKRTIIAWGEAGGPEGDPADATHGLAVETVEESAPEGGWWIGEPDLVVSFAEPYEVPDGMRDLNMANTFDVPDDFTEPRWIKASEMRGGPNVHHICGEPFGCITPGWDPYQYKKGYGQLLPPVDEIGVSMHYNKPAGPGTGFVDAETKGALIFYEDGDTIQHFVRRSVLHADFPPVPAGHPYFSYTHEHEFEEDSYILSFTPHMHLRGRAAKYELQYPDGTTELLLWVPDYDFEWQRTYVFKDPPVAPKGSKVLWTATWDNSEHNPHNPDPTVDVPYGGPTFMEMANGWMDYTSVEPLNHVVGQDPIPQDILDEVTEQLNERAESDSFSPVWAPGYEPEEGQEQSSTPVSEGAE